MSILWCNVIARTEITIIPSIPTCDRGRSKSALCLKIATTVAAIENAAKSMATMPVVLERASKPGKERKVTDALNTTAALQRQWKVGFYKKGRCIGLTTRQVQAPMTSVGVAYRRPLSSSIILDDKRVRS